MDEEIVTEDDLITMIPFIIVLVPIVILISKLFPNLFDNDDKYFKSYKPHNPGWFGKEI